VRKLYNQIIEKYYVPFKKEEETLKQTIHRVDNLIAEERFKHICNRDIITKEGFNGSKRLD
tara:strand:- start:10 stop:192 length:183 start_codon:yes stop_codon:yes gene_type:complete